MGYWARFAGLVGARSGRWGGHTGDRRRWPPRLPSAASLRPGRETGGMGGFWGLAEVEKLSNFAGATHGWMFAGARPWDRRRAAGHRSAADRGSTFIRGDGPLARPRPSRRHGAQGLVLRARQGAHRGDR
jgi:hypothetical protein